MLSIHTPIRLLAKQSRIFLFHNLISAYHKSFSMDKTCVEKKRKIWFSSIDRYPNYFDFFCMTLTVEN